MEYPWTFSLAGSERGQVWRRRESSTASPTVGQRVSRPAQTTDRPKLVRAKLRTTPYPIILCPASRSDGLCLMAVTAGGHNLACQRPFCRKNFRLGSTTASTSENEEPYPALPFYPHPNPNCYTCLYILIGSLATATCSERWGPRLNPFGGVGMTSDTRYWYK